VLVSVVLWIAFDFLSIFTGLAARVLLPDLADPMSAYPSLAALVLSPWAAALFTVGLFATVMSTLDSNLFIAATTVGHDFARNPLEPETERRRTRWGLVLSAALAASGAMLFDSVVEVWHHVGSVVTSTLLLPVIAVHLPSRWRPSQTGVVFAMVLAAATSSLWILGAGAGGYPLGVEPMFAALAASASCLVIDRLRRA
jgi:SSS family solute:Na+ symporter